MNVKNIFLFQLPSTPVVLGRSWCTSLVLENTIEQLFTFVRVFCSAINFQVKLSTFQHEYLELTFTIFQLEYLEIFLGLLPPAARLLLPPVAKMMTEFLKTYNRTHHTNLVEHGHVKIRAYQLRGQQKLLFSCKDMGGGGVTLLFTIFWTKKICNK